MRTTREENCRFRSKIEKQSSENSALKSEIKKNSSYERIYDKAKTRYEPTERQCKGSA